MHWILSATPSYNLRNTLHQSEWLVRTPFLLQRSNLTRVETLSGSRTLAVSVTQTSSGLILQTDSQLNGDAVEALTERMRRVLRIDDAFMDFYDKAYETPALTNVILFGARTIRGASVFEDIITAATATRTIDTAPSFHITSWIADRLGDALPRNPTLHAFPAPRQLLTNKRLLGEMLSEERIDQVCRIAEYFDASETPALANDAGLPTDYVADQMQSSFDLDNQQLSLLMFFLSRYDYIPVDFIAQSQARAFWMHAQPDYANNVELAFERWQPWGGLAYWLWDWSSVPQTQKNLNRTETYG